VHFYFCILIFIFNFITVFIRVLFFYCCLDLIVYIVPFIIVLYLSIQLQSCQSVSINLLTYLLTYSSLTTPLQKRLSGG